MKYVIWNSILPLKWQKLITSHWKPQIEVTALFYLCWLESYKELHGEHHLRVWVYSAEGRKLHSSVVSLRTAIRSEQVSLMPRRSNSDDFRNTAAGINLALHNKNENFIAAEQLSVLYLLWVDIKHQRRNIRYGLNFFYCYSWCQLLSKIEIFS